MMIEGLKYMWLFVLFDLPVVEEEDRKEYTQFRRFLLSDGYYMMQYSVYCRICKGEIGLDKHASRLEQHLPPNGNIRMMRVTEMQYAQMKILVGTMKKKEKFLGNQLLFL